MADGENTAPLEPACAAVGERSRRTFVRRRCLVPLVVLAAMAVVAATSGTDADVFVHGEGAVQAVATGAMLGWNHFLSPAVLVVILVLLSFSAFFSACETAFLSIPRPRVRGMREENTLSARLVVRMLDNPGQLLTTILVGNMLVNTVVGVVLGTRVKDLFEVVLGFPSSAAYVCSITLTTSVLLFFGEITPKVFAVRLREHYARLAVFPLIAVGRFLSPLRDSLLRVTDLLFRITHFHDLRAAPFITDAEIKSLLSGGEAKDSIEEDGRQMIRRILDFHDAQLREILVPRMDIVAIPEDATVGQAFEIYRQQQYSRMPVYRDDLDHITGVLFAKDLLPSIREGELDASVKALARPPHFVPETMTVQGFIRRVQRLRSHLAIVVDEYGGTEGIVTLHDAIEKVVGDIRDESDEEEHAHQRIGEGVYRVSGGLPLDEIAEITGVRLEDEEHQTVAGFLMNKTDRVLSVGDRISVSGMTFTVESVEGKRASAVRVELTKGDEEEKI